MPSTYRKNRSPLKPHLTNAGGVAAEVKNLRDDIFSEISGDIWASQAAWLVDPANGNDRNIGTPAQPIKTVAELNMRFDRLRLKVAPTITFSGDCIDAPFMFNGVLAPGLGMTLNGTVTTEATATITVVTSLGSGGNTFPFALTTTGYTWTSADVGKRITLSSGHFSWVQEFTDANNVITGNFVNSAGSTATPTALPITIDSLSKLSLPTIGGMANSLGQNISFNNFDVVNTFSSILITSGINTSFIGCRFTKASSTFNLIGPSTMRGCGFMGAASLTFRGNAAVTLAATTWVGGSLIAVSSPVALQQFSASNCPLIFTNPQFSQLNIVRIRNTANPITTQTGGVLFNNNNSTVHGTTGNTGVGIRVLTGSQFQWLGAAAKPTVAGATDVQIGLTSYTYAQLGTGLLDLTTAVPPLITGTPAAMFQV